MSSPPLISPIPGSSVTSQPHLMRTRFMNALSFAVIARNDTCSAARNKRQPAAREAETSRTSSWLGGNNRRSRPVFRKDLDKQNSKRLLRLVLHRVRNVPGFKKIIAGLVDRRPPALSECDLAGKHKSNAGADVVMHSKVSVRGKRDFGGAHFD